MTNRPNGVLYVGVTADMERRASEHRQKLIDGFTKRYGLTRLVYIEPHDQIESAIQREKRIKECPRAWKIRLVARTNPDWTDLCVTQFGWPPVVL